jgi:hypothetical protein
MNLSRLLLLPFLTMLVPAATPVPGPDGWITLFGAGKDLSAFTDAGGKPTKWTIDQAALHGDDKRGDIWTKAVFADFILEVEFKTTGNSGVFFRTANPKDPVQTGIEIQVDNPGGPNVHSVGAIYDLVAPRQNAAKAGEWNTYRITAKGPEISVELNGTIVAEMNVDRWTEAGKNPDGTPNKYRKALKDFARSGHIGFQDHGHSVWYRNIRVKPLP